jgi:hypothetical protein
MKRRREDGVYGVTEPERTDGNNSFLNQSSKKSPVFEWLKHLGLRTSPPSKAATTFNRF